MSGIGKVFILGLVFFALSALTLAAVKAGSSVPSTPPQPPQGFQILKQATGVQLYQKNYKNGNPDYVQLINLNQGAKVKLMHGKITSERPGKGAFGGNDARILSQSLNAFWKKATSKYETPFCITNGQFFYMPESPTRLSFPLKVDGQILTDGYAAQEFIDQKLMLELWDDHADIRELSKEALYQSTAPNIIGGLKADANKRIKHAVGRTFTGIDDRDGDKIYETVLIFTTRTAYQSEAEAVLRNFGAEKVMMLDGGGSTQLICNGESIIYSERLIPQALAVISGGEKHTLALNSNSQSLLLPEYLETESESTELDLINSTRNVATSIGEPDISKNKVSTHDGNNENVTQNVAIISSKTMNFDSSEAFSIDDAVWIPTIMMPLALVIFLIAFRIRQANA